MAVGVSSSRGNGRQKEHPERRQELGFSEGLSLEVDDVYPVRWLLTDIGMVNVAALSVSTSERRLLLYILICAYLRSSVGQSHM